MAASLPTEESGATAVTGTLLALAITVALAAVVVGIVQLVDYLTPPAIVGFAPTADGAFVAAAPPEQAAVWGDEGPPGIVASCGPGTLVLRESGEPVVAGDLVRAGDRITGCDPGGTLVVTDTAAGTLVYRDALG